MAQIKVTRFTGAILIAAAAVIVALGVWNWPGSEPLSTASGQSNVGQHTSAAGAHSSALITRTDDVIGAQLVKQNEALERIAERLTDLESKVLSNERSRREHPAPPLPEAELFVEDELQVTADDLEEQFRSRAEAADEEGRRQVAAIDRGWMIEPVDHRWAGAYEEQVRVAFHTSDFESASLMDVNCRSSVCKMEFVGDPSVDLQDVNAAMIALEPFQETQFTITKPEDGGPGQIVVYVARPGSTDLSQFTDGLD